MAIHHLGMTKEGFNLGRADRKASAGGHEIFGKSGGGHGGISSDLISSPMSPQMMPACPKLKERE